jgi:hypothetical protein
MAIMAVFLFTKDFQSATGGAVAPLKHCPELVDVNELASADLEDPNKGLLFGELKVVGMLGDALL